MSFPARYDGMCLPCGEPIVQGESITNHPDAGYVHEDCAEDVGKTPQTAVERRVRDDPARATMPRGKTARDRCDRCFMVHSPGQAGCE
jgi:hypothetical protein